MAADWNEFYQKVCDKYNLNKKEHFWLHPKSEKYIIFHSAIQIIASQLGMQVITFKLSEDVGANGVHMMYGAVSFIEGNKSKKFIVQGTHDGIYLTENGTKLTFTNPPLFTMEFMADKAYVDVGEGDQRNFLEGYKKIIVSKRAYDRAALGLIADEFNYQIFTEQDAEIMNGVMGAKKKPDQDAADIPEKDTNADEERNKSFKHISQQLRKWVTTAGIESAEKYLETVSKILSTLTQEQQDSIRDIIKNAKKMQNESAFKTDDAPPEPKETAVPSDKTLPTPEEIGTAANELTDKAISIAKQLLSCKSGVEMHTVANNSLSDVRVLPPSLREYLTRIKKMARQNFKTKGDSDESDTKDTGS